MNAALDDVLPLLRCPETGAPLRRKSAEELVSEAGIVYPIRGGIPDLVIGANKERYARMEGSYDAVSGWRYDFALTSTVIQYLFWGVDKRKLPRAAEIAGGFPDGVIVDVPAGTAVFTAEAYLAKPKSVFLSVDYSMGMLRVAERRLKKAGASNFVLVRADVAHLPLRDAALDGAVSLNGFHVFPEPEAGARELGRCLKPGAPFVATAACAGERYFSDVLIERFMIPNGYFHHGLPVAAYRAMFEAGGVADLHLDVRGAFMMATGKKGA
ncbi:MAG: methyltransferase domain-containing protein [Candidatus Methylomirabilis sp.]|nr:methyltransferase domain-containing protein [Deltaproteobacteria bacterium]